MRRYASNQQPSYGLKNITAPVALFYDQNDWLAGYQDVKKLYTHLPSQSAKALIKVALDNFNHVDFLWGIDAPELVYEKMLELMKIYK